MSLSCFGGICGILARSPWKRLGLGDLGPQPCKSLPSVMSTATPEFRLGASPLSLTEGHLQRWSTWAWAWLCGALEGSQPLTESEPPFPLPLNALVLAWRWTNPSAPHGLPSGTAMKVQPRRASPFFTSRRHKIHIAGPTATPLELLLPLH